MRSATLCALALIVAASHEGGAQERVLDDFKTVEAWTAHPSDGVSLQIAADRGRTGSAMRLDFDFHAGGGYAIARRALPLTLPADYELTLWIRADSPPQNLELKLIDSTGENVWWTNRRAFRFPPAWTRLVTKKRHIEFAWGPVRAADLHRVSAIEIAITAGSGGKGSVWLDDFTIADRTPDTAAAGAPLVSASSSAARSAAAFAADGDTATAWRSSGGAQRLDLDLGGPREFGAVVLRWAPREHATDYQLLTSSDGRVWDLRRAVRSGNGGADFLYMPESEARFVRLALNSSVPGRAYALREIELKPIDWAPTPNSFFERIAEQTPPGRLPKYFLRTQSYWTVVGESGDAAEALINEEGMVEAQAAAFSIEPFLRVGNRVFTWRDARAVQRLERGTLPIPSVRWEGLPLALDVTAVVSGPAGASTLWARYRVANPGRIRRRATLYLALRPFQVNPSWQFLNVPGGVGRIDSLSYDGAVVRLNGDRVIVPVTRPEAFGAASFDQGDITDFLSRGSLPPSHHAADGTGWGSGALAYAWDLEPGGKREVWIAAPFHSASRSPQPNVEPDRASVIGDSVLEAATREWEARLGTARIALPASGSRVTNSLRSNLAYILINRDGPAIQPGSRSYKRSWIRDGSLTSEALLRLGHSQEVREFIEWYAPHQYPSGKVPCCVDRRGADPVPENDSHGQLIYLIAEYWRFTGDTALVKRMWPHITRAVEYIDSLRRSRMTPVYRADSLPFFGLLPQSISHEGYSAKPMHSYWDDFFALKGLKDAAMLSLVVGDTARAPAYAAMRDEFRANLLDSFRRAMALHQIDYLPGAVELGDFDATSTTVGINPGGELANLPGEAVARTFDRYWRQFLERRDSDTTWEAYTPYEHRVIGTFVRLGQRERAHELLDFFLRDRRPEAWNHWAEVVWRNPATPKFIGDMPHTWVGSDFIRSVLDMFAYEREADSSLVIGAGIKREWVSEPPGVAVSDLRTHYGPVSYTMRREGRDLRVLLRTGPRIPRGGIAVLSPIAGAPVSVLVNGTLAPVSRTGEIMVTRLPADIVIRY